MTAPALVILANGTPEPQVSQVIHALRKCLQARRPELVVRGAFLDDASPSAAHVLSQLSKMAVQEVAFVPMDVTHAIDHGSDVTALLHRSRAAHPDMRFAVSRPVGPATELLTLLDQRMRTALAEARILELDGLVLSAPCAGDVRGSALLARRARQWSAHHRLPCTTAVADGSGPTVAQAISGLRVQGRRHIAVGSFFLTADDAYAAQAALAERCGAVAVSRPFGPDEQIIDLVLARYAFAAMDLLDAFDDFAVPAAPRLSMVGA